MGKPFVSLTLASVPSKKDAEKDASMTHSNGQQGSMTINEVNANTDIAMKKPLEATV